MDSFCQCPDGLAYARVQTISYGDCGFPLPFNAYAIHHHYSNSDDTNKIELVKVCTKSIQYPVHPAVFELVKLVSADEYASFQLKRSLCSLLSRIQEVTCEEIPFEWVSIPSCDDDV